MSIFASIYSEDTFGEISTAQHIMQIDAVYIYKKHCNILQAENNFRKEYREDYYSMIRRYGRSVMSTVAADETSALKRN